MGLSGTYRSLDKEGVVGVESLPYVSLDKEGVVGETLVSLQGFPTRFPYKVSLQGFPTLMN